MNDFIRVEQNISDILKNIEPKLFEIADWQTLTLGCWLRDFVITENGLLQDNYDGTFTDVEYHGIIHFYFQHEKIKQEFNAKFTDGKLVEITEVLKNKRFQ